MPLINNDRAGHRIVRIGKITAIAALTIGTVAVILLAVALIFLR